MEYLFCCASVCFVAATVVTHMAKYGLLSKSLQHQIAEINSWIFGNVSTEIESWISRRFPVKLKVEFLKGSQWKLIFSNVPSEIGSWISQRFPVKLEVEFLKGSQWNWKLNFSKVSAEIESWFLKCFHWNWGLSLSNVSAEIESWISEMFPLKLKVEFLKGFPLKLKVEFFKGFSLT